MRRLAWILALTAIGDGVVGALMPIRHMRRWSQGPDWYRSLIRPFADHPQVTRALSVAQVVAGVAWTSQMSDDPTT
ncbi:MAG: hypothetical protein MUF83_08010 [Acidimicrobiales bacterium]|jgi:hypothetical protein|nr:hypothetical protein [Acidimicrobiales bacterium]